MQLTEEEFWKEFVDVYNKTKEIYIKCEEYDAEFCSIMQPIKEQRDALDHIVRYYSDSSSEPEDIEKNSQNFQKAMGHIYRAYFDTADILSIILREKISKLLSEFSYSEIVSCWKNYLTCRKVLTMLPLIIARLRKEKEVKFTTQGKQKMFEEYSDVLKFLFSTLDTAYQVAPALYHQYKIKDTKIEIPNVKELGRLRSQDTSSTEGK